MGLLFFLLWGGMACQSPMASESPVALPQQPQVLTTADCHSQGALQSPVALPQQRSFHVSHFGNLRESDMESLRLSAGGKDGSFHSTFYDRGQARYFLPDEAEGLSLESVRGARSFGWDLDPEGTDFWLILTRSYLGGDLRATLLRDDLAVHPVNHVRIHNLSKFPMRGSVNGTPFAVDPRGEVVLSYDPSTASHLVFRAEWWRHEQWEQAYMTSRQLRPGRRLNLFCEARPNANLQEGMSMMMHTLQEWVSEPYDN